MQNLPLYWNVQIGNVSQTKVNESLQILLAKMILEALLGKFFGVFHGVKAIFRKGVFRFVDQVLFDLLSDFNDVWAGNNSKVDSFSFDSIKAVDHGLLDVLSSWSQGLINIKEANNSFVHHGFDIFNY